MDSTCRTRSLSSLNKDMTKGNILLSHKLQRPEGQWNRKQKSDLIDSLLRKYPINPTYAIKESDGKLYIIDGVQRLSTIRDFIDNKFAMSKDLDPIVVNDVEKNIAGLKFKKLDEETQDAILNSELQIYTLTDCTEKDVREIFRRQNAGKPLDKKNLMVVYGSDDFNDAVYTLSRHDFMDKVLTAAQVKKAADKNAIIQTFMLIQSDNDKEYTSFRDDDVKAFVTDNGDSCIALEEDFITVLDKLNTAFDSDKVAIPVTSLPMVLYAGYKVIKGKKSFTKLVDLINEFIVGYDNNEDYKQYVKSGTTSSENVKGRFEYWKNLIKAA